MSETPSDASLVAHLRARLALAPPEVPSRRWRVPVRDGGSRVLRQRLAQARSPMRQAAVLIPVIDRRAGPTVLFTRRSPHLRHHPGQISFPGGRIEAADDGPVAAALRETREEVGIDPASVDVIGCLDTYLTGTGFTIVPVVGVVRPFSCLQVDAREVDEVFEVPLDFLVDPGNHAVRPREVSGIHVECFEIDFGHHRIWGATAGIIIGLYEKWSGINTAEI